ncbi:hypothetical protein C2S53_014449 [Perilla frutescens var. hirtella]|uniref:Uncharacterized protein n=1 Tax=Perilla frutescens var. hirtella TaxID=608512 RepID=A0AAD4J6G4_PERFH|nr:hypothetical protein C2S53_014449 [Perilla frutescens var. hirtella]
MFSPYQLSFLITFIFLTISSQSTVPPSRRFKYVNEGDFGEYYVEHGADYRILSISNYPFNLCFYNTTPDAFILGLRMGHRRSESVMRWVWDANRTKPVRENATLTFSSDGNLVLADADGSVAWQTGTTNKGVVGLELLPNGNMVLYDSKGGYIWQSFDHPTDTLLVGQALKTIGAGPTKLTSRMSIIEPFNGPYSFVMEKRHWALYYQTKNARNPLLYYKSGEFGNGKGALAYLGFSCEPEYGGSYAFELGFTFNLSKSDSSGTRILSRPKYNSTYTMLRVDIDGNLRMYTYNEHVDWGAWEVTYVLFNRDGDEPSECGLPKRCGSLGICEESQCVACPTSLGVLGWSKSCAPPKLPPCKGIINVDYFKVEGVEHYTSGYNEGAGPMSLGQCRDKCSKDCKCLGFFYRAESSKCLVVPELGTLVKVSNASHVGYIKMAK